MVFYLEQEGRSAGSLVKAHAYAEAERSSTDTFAYYETLGLAPDPRDYQCVCDTLVDIGVDHVRLLTNNLLKVVALESAGIRVDRVPVLVETSAFADDYIDAKRRRGHLL